jgi:hypothetical protein
MGEKKIVVPEGMLKAAWHAQLPADNPTWEWDEGDEMQRKFYRRIFEAALRWLAENPIPTTTNSMCALVRYCRNKYSPQIWESWTEWARSEVLLVEWQRRMFLAPEPEIPEEVKDLLANTEQFTGIPLTIARAQYNSDIIEAFHRGQKAVK